MSNPRTDVAKGGQPTKYEPRFAKMAFKACLLGATDEDLAAFFEVSVATISNWKNSQPKFLEAIKNGKDKADMEVAESLRKRALGFEHVVTEAVLDKAGQPVIVDGKPLRVRVVKYFPPSEMAGIYWLNNRQKKNWRQKQEHDVEIHGNMSVRTVSYADALPAIKAPEKEPSSADPAADN